jgi:hypothetical protein
MSDDHDPEVRHAGCKLQLDMNPTVRRARVAHLQATISLERALRQGRPAEAAALADHKTDCADALIKAIRTVNPTYFDLPRVPCALHKECA